MQRKNTIRLIARNQTVAEIIQSTREITSENGLQIFIADEFNLYNNKDEWVLTITSQSRGYIEIMDGHRGEKVLIKHFVAALIL